jgi:hypothetical protein
LRHNDKGKPPNEFILQETFPPSAKKLLHPSNKKTAGILLMPGGFHQSEIFAGKDTPSSALQKS